MFEIDADIYLKVTGFEEEAVDAIVVAELEYADLGNEMLVSRMVDFVVAIVFIETGIVVVTVVVVT